MSDPVPPVPGAIPGPAAAERIYLDNNSTTPLHPSVAAVWVEACRAGYANPASQHRPGQQARRILEDAREAIGMLLGAQIHARPADRVVLVSGGTEANNLALLGLVGAQTGRILVSSIEHPSVLGPAQELARRGCEVCRLAVTATGIVDLAQFDQLLTPDTLLVSVMLANHETGVIQPVPAIAERCHALGIPLHVDAAQAVGKIPVDFHALGASTLTVAPHKFHGPLGIGALLVRARVPLYPQLWGGNQQDGLRPGTENVAATLAFRQALQLWQQESQQRPLLLARLRNEFESRLCAAWPETQVIGKAAPRLPHVSNLAFPSFNRQALLVALDQAGIACSTGSACASGSSEPSPVLQAMGLPEPVVEAALRFSFNCLQDQLMAVEATHRILLVLENLRSRIPATNFAAAARQ